ncbi:hypothetical protein EHP00_442 [Ecytonucleospora hepatopenaei]|uniref:Uncharacterized protein n=1 Tax=Ecytonucleospora hepatopenaei TaxID=646526 RepID=A0A1W0E947_9MICR|nr:hypothetical protein EHP00_442 [Ecytonucleospora hepatopenaei]
MSIKKQEIEEEINRLSEELDACTYEEDKQEILKQILQYSYTCKGEVAAFCLSSVFKSFFELEETEIVYKILESVFQSEDAPSYVEMIFDDVTNVRLFFELSHIEIVYFIEKVFKVKETAHILKKHKKYFTSFLSKIVLNNSCTNNLSSVMEYCVRVTGGDILLFLSENKLFNKIKNHLILEIMIDNKITNKDIVLQNINSMNYTPLMVNTCLDRNSKLLKTYQTVFYKKTFIHEIIKNKLWDLAYNLVHENPEGLKIIVENVTIDELMAESEKSYNAANILDLYFMAENPHIKINANFYVAQVLAAIRGVEHSIIEEDVQENISCNFLVFCIMTGNYESKFLNCDDFLASKVPVAECTDMCMILKLFIKIINKEANKFEMTLTENICVIYKIINIFTSTQVCSKKTDQMIAIYAFEYYVALLEAQEKKTTANYKEITVKYNTEINKEIENRNEVVSLDHYEGENGSFLGLENLEKLNKGIKNVFNFFRKEED